MNKSTQQKKHKRIIHAFFKDGYSVQTIAAHYKIATEHVEDKIRKYCRRKK